MAQQDTAKQTCNSTITQLLKIVYSRGRSWLNCYVFVLVNLNGNITYILLTIGIYINNNLIIYIGTYVFIIAFQTIE